MAVPLHVELKSAKPFDLIEEEAHLSIVRTAAVLEREFMQLLKPFGLTVTQYNVLRILRGAGPAGLCRNELGARLLREVPDVTRLLDRMKAARLISRDRVDADRRLVRTHLTARGLALLDEIDGRIRQAHRERLAHVSRPKLRALVDTLAEVRTGGGSA